MVDPLALESSFCPSVVLSCAGKCAASTIFRCSSNRMVERIGCRTNLWLGLGIHHSLQLGGFGLLLSVELPSSSFNMATLVSGCIFANIITWTSSVGVFPLEGWWFRCPCFTYWNPQSLNKNSHGMHQEFCCVSSA